MNLNSLIFTSSDYKLVVSCNGIPAPLSTVESFDYSRKVEHEYIHVIGSDEPQGLKTNTATYPGKITIEAGELEVFLAALGYVFASQIKDATISIVTFAGDLVKVFKNCVFVDHSGTVKAKDKRSLITLSFESIGAVGI